jgi:cob(I)alamin adenosyltransferase
MPEFYTRMGDDGSTGLLGEGRVAKYAARIEAVGELDEASAVLGFARSICLSEQTKAIILDVQRDIYRCMAEVAATPENAARFREIDERKVAWLESQISLLSQQTQIPSEFILPGDSPAGAAFSLSRTVVRRAERVITRLLHTTELENWEILRYLNRLSSLCFVLELLENQVAGQKEPTLAKKR